MTAVTQNPTNQTNGHKCANCGSTTTAKRMNGKLRWHDIGRGKFLCENCYRKKRKAGEISAGKRGRRTSTTEPASTGARSVSETPKVNDIVERVLAELKGQMEGKAPATESKSETKQGRPPKRTVEQAREARLKVAEILSQKKISDVQKIRDILNVVQGTTT